ncbi:hypothetical protein ABKW31_22680, partial [Paraglaciecola sp. 25GB23A]
MFTFLSKLRLKSCFVFFVLLSANFAANASIEGQWLQVSAGELHSSAIKLDGTLWAWGSNNYGELGVDSTVSATAPVKIGIDTNWRFVNAGGYRTLAIKSDNTLWAWGDNRYGQLGDGSKTNRNTPTQVSTESDWQTAVAGTSHSLAIKTDGTLWAWGLNHYGQLGEGSTINRMAPVQIGNETNWQSVEVGGSYSLAIKTDGSLWGWGFNGNGQLGDGTNTSKNTPVQIGSENDWLLAGAGGDSSFAIKTNGTLWAWGDNGYGQLGDGTTISKNTPTQVASDSNWQSVAVGFVHTLALKTDGTLWAWGSNYYGELGDGSSTNRTTPVQIGIDTSWRSITVGGDGASGGHSLGTKTDDGLWAWGSNSFGKLGFEGTTKVTFPVQDTPVVKQNFQSIASGHLHSIALDENSVLWSWGMNRLGQLGNGESGFYLTESSPIIVKPESTWKSIASGTAHNLAINSDGTLWAWGANYQRQLGADTSGHILTPTKISTDNTWTQVSASGSWGSTPSGQNFALKVDGTLWSWGNNSYGQLGHGYGADSIQELPTQVGIDTDWFSVAAGRTHTIAIKTDGTLWAWGSNSLGQLGLGSANNGSYISPTRVGVDTSWTQIVAGDSFTLAIKSDGSLWSWGANNSGKLGHGTLENKTTPVQVGVKKDWRTVKAGDNHVIAIKFDGTLWAWGLNSTGQLGTSDTLDRLEPYRINDETNWAYVSAGSSYSFAIKMDGTRWGWGWDMRGSLGSGLSSHSGLIKSTPEQLIEVDSDNDGVSDTNDVFPQNNNEQFDTDGDGIGNNADIDDDNDGIPDEYEINNSLNSLDALDALIDHDGDGIVAMDEYLYGSSDNNINDIPANLDFTLYSFEAASCQVDFSYDPNWEVTNRDGYHGSHSYKIAGHENGGSSSLTYQNTFNDGHFSFALKVSTEDQYDELILRVDDAEIARYSGEQDWTLYRYPITAGERSISWTYIKDSADSAGDDSVWIDSIVLPVNTDPDNNGIHNETRPDDDCDGYLDLDEIAAGSDPLRASSLPLDTDGDFISNATDLDDDNDGILDVNDTYPLVAIG